MSAILLLLLLTACGQSSSPVPTPFPSPTPPRFIAGKLGVKILPSTGPRTLSAKVPVISFHLKVTGLHLDAPNMGQSPIPRHGHIQVYLDRIPKDAYKTADLKGVVANLAAPVFSSSFPASLLKGKPGKHRLLVTLARNDYILYHTRPAILTVTFK